MIYFIKPELRTLIRCAGGIGHAGGETGFPPGVLALADDFPDGEGSGGGGMEDLPEQEVVVAEVVDQEDDLL